MIVLGATMMPLCVYANDNVDPADTTVARHFDMEEVTVVGFKQDALGRDPIAVTSFSEAFVHNTEMTSIKDLGYTVPNFYIPEYGSRQTSPVFVRGVGSKTNGPTVGFYVDGVPHMERSSFDDDRHLCIRSTSRTSGHTLRPQLYRRNNQRLHSLAA